MCYGFCSAAIGDSERDGLRDLVRIGYSDMGDYARIDERAGNIYPDFASMPEGATKAI